MSAARTPTRPFDPLHDPMPRARELFPVAARWGLIVALSLTGAYVLWQVLAMLLPDLLAANPNFVDPFARLLTRTGLTPADGVFFWLWLVLTACCLFAASWLVVTCVILMWISRDFTDRVSTALGFAATFFGLAMLTIFFAVLFFEVAEYFHYMPHLVEQNNQRLLKAQAELKNAETFKTKALAEIKVSLDEIDSDLAKAEKRGDAKAKKELVEERAGLLKMTVGDADITINELRKVASGDLREDTSAWGCFIHFLTAGPSSEAQNVGIRPALIGSGLIALITILFAVPVGVGAAVYLEEYRWTSPMGKRIQGLIQVNINNLAGVPAVVYGILGAATVVMLFQYLEKQGFAVEARNLLGGGLTLGLLTLPMVIVSTQEAIKAVPKSIREGAYALGATQWQTIWRQVLPMSLPGILTGTILSVSRAIGEAAALVMFGALLFVQGDPGLFTRFTVMPMQIFGWADRPPERIDGVPVHIWQYNSALAILVLLFVLLLLNAVAIIMRNRAQRKMRA